MDLYYNININAYRSFLLKIFLHGNKKKCAVFSKLRACAVTNLFFTLSSPVYVCFLQVILNPELATIVAAHSSKFENLLQHFTICLGFHHLE